MHIKYIIYSQYTQIQNVWRPSKACSCIFDYNSKKGHKVRRTLNSSWTAFLGFVKMRESLRTQTFDQTPNWTILLCTMHYALCTLHYALCTVQYALCTVHYALCTMHHAIFSMHCALCSMHYALCTMPYALCTTHYAVSTASSTYWLPPLTDDVCVRVTMFNGVSFRGVRCGTESYSAFSRVKQGSSWHYCSTQTHYIV